MSRYVLQNEQFDFQNLAEAKIFIDNKFPQGTPVKVTDTKARPGDSAYFTYISGIEGCVKSNHLPTSPLR